nr:hypothetical protein [Amycolatopsis anabasis]
MPAIPAPVFLLGSVVSIQFGQAFGKQLSAHTGPAGAIALRLGFAAVLLLVIHRPALPPWNRVPLVLGFGTAIAGMNLIYPALRFLPLAVASTIQLLGPLAVAIVTSRRFSDLCFGLLAVLGVWLCGNPFSAPLPLPGVAFALASAVSMGAYLLLSRRAGTGSVDGSALALAVAWAAVLTIPFGATEIGAAFGEPRGAARRSRRRRAHRGPSLFPRVRRVAPPVSRRRGHIGEPRTGGRGSRGNPDPGRDSGSARLARDRLRGVRGRGRHRPRAPRRPPWQGKP